MPFTDNLPGDNTLNWYSPLVTAWTNLKNFVNSLEASFVPIDTTNAPNALGIAAPGIATGASASDHVHPMPSLHDLTDVTVAGAANGKILGKLAGEWVAIDPPSGGGGGSSTQVGATIAASGNYTIPATGTYDVSVIGGGGGGAGAGSALTSGGVATQRGGGAGGSGVKQTVRQAFTLGDVISFVIATAAVAGTGGAANGATGVKGGEGGSSSATWSSGGGGAISAAGGAAGGPSAANSTAYAVSGNAGQPFYQQGGWPGCGGNAQYGGRAPGGIDGVGTGGGAGGSANATLGGGGGEGGKQSADGANGGGNNTAATTAGTVGGAGARGGGGGGGGGGAPGGVGGAGGAGGAGYGLVTRVG